MYYCISELVNFKGGMHLIWRLDKNRGICPQICEQLCARIVAQEFLPGQRLMSVREVALAAGVNPNTVQRAFEQLESQGVLRSERGSGWYVTEDIQCAQELYRAMITQKCRQFFSEMADLGMTPEKVKAFVKEWEYE